MTTPHPTGLALSLAGVGLVVEADAPAWLERARLWAGPFVGADATAPLVIRAHSRPGPPPSTAAMRADSERGPAASWDGPRLRLTAATFTARADVARRTATVEGPPLLYPLETLIRHLLPALVGDAIVVHGALLVEDGRAWVASGPSGAGKSTLAGLFPEHALCDERCVVRSTGGRLVAASLPYWRGRPGAAPLAGVHLLTHAPAAGRRRLAVAEAAPRLTRELELPSHDPGLLARGFAVLAQLLDQVPVWELGFAPDRTVWPVLSAAGEAA